MEKAPWAGDAYPLEAAASADGGPTVRTIYDRSTLEHPGALPTVEALIRSGQQTRVLPELPVSLSLADDRLAVLPREIAGRPAIAVVHPSALLDGLIRLFEELWQRAFPLGQAEASPTTKRDQSTGTAGQQRLVMLLLSGLTDEAIARQLGVGYRSAQRRVAALMAELDAHTRFQAGVQAALRGYPNSERWPACVSVSPVPCPTRRPCLLRPGAHEPCGQVPTGRRTWPCAARPVHYGR
ncbi:MAG TPA: hypothetical protein VFY84_19020 [Jiangellales bacterium]|nr:hypothetical protein [Jiangellales bacterium]